MSLAGGTTHLQGLARSCWAEEQALAPADAETELGEALV